MHLDVSPEQQELHDAAADFARRELAAAPGEGLDRELWGRCAAFGIQGLTLPAEHGGQGHDPVTAALILEGLGRGAAAVGPLFAIGAHAMAVATPVALLGDESQRSTLLPGLCDGTLVAAYAASEPTAGSDSAAIGTRARSDDAGETYVIDGSKTWVTNAPAADLFLVTATADDGSDSRRASAFLVDRATDGITVGPAMAKMGLAGAPMSEVWFDGVRVPASRRLGADGQGAAVFRTAMIWERALIMAPHVGAMKRQLDACVAHAGARKQFGQHIGAYQAVSHRIARMAMRYEAARLMLLRGASTLGRGRAAMLAASMTKAHVSEAAVEQHSDALRVFGASGYTGDLGIERDLRDAFGALIHSGTNDIQLNVIAALIGV